MKKRDILETNISVGQEAYNRLEARMQKMKEEAEAETDAKERSTLFAELCGIVYGLIFLKQELETMRFQKLLLAESGILDEDVEVASETNDDLGDIESRLRDMMS